MATTKKNVAGKKLPENMALDEEQQKDFSSKVKKIKKSAPSVPSIPGVIYLGHVPHGFYETQMRSYFSQFGKVNRLRLSRSKKSARSKGYGFVEFAEEEVAKIVARSMDNYLMFNRLLKCKLVASEELHPDTFKNWNRPFQPSNRTTVNRLRHSRPQTDEAQRNAAKKRRKRQQKGEKRLSEAGIDVKLLHCQTAESMLDSGIAESDDSDEEFSKPRKLAKTSFESDTVTEISPTKIVKSPIVKKSRKAAPKSPDTLSSPIASPNAKKSRKAAPKSPDTISSPIASPDSKKSRKSTPKSPETLSTPKASPNVKKETDGSRVTTRAMKKRKVDAE